MALNDDAVLVPGVGHMFTNDTLGSKWTLAQVNTYASAGTIPAGWDEFGHTDLDTILAFQSEGGDTSTKGSWQNPSLRTVITSASVDSIVVNAEQVLDDQILSFYHGGGDYSTTTGEFGWPDAPAAQEKAFMLVMLDGADPLGLAVPKASLLRNDVPTFASDDFLKLPIKITILQQTGMKRAYWINDALGSGAA